MRERVSAKGVRYAGDDSTQVMTGMIMQGSQRNYPDNILQFRRELKRAALCAQCRIPMILVRGEPEIADASAMRFTYQCAECGLVERINEDRVQ